MAIATAAATATVSLPSTASAPVAKVRMPATTVVTLKFFSAVASR
jgi:hypothetical protein